VVALPFAKQRGRGAQESDTKTQGMPEVEVPVIPAKAGIQRGWDVGHTAIS